jgi:ABC-type transporter Mla maintaining outer membrane lipid asymmetry ATPase subunit MlaF
VIEVRDLHKRFGDHVVLDGINLTVERGTTFVVLGGSG